MTLLIKVDNVVIDGKQAAFEDGSFEVTGATRFENDAVPAATGPDGARRRRIPTTIRLNMMFGASADPDAIAAQRNVQITGRDTVSGKRALMQNCMFGSMGPIGAGGTVQVTYLVLTPIQWL